MVRGHSGIVCRSDDTEADATQKSGACGNPASAGDRYFRGIEGVPYSVARDDGAYIVSVDLPFTEKEGIDLSRHRDELVIDLGTWRRTLVLPRILVDVPTAGATFEDGTLKIRFANPASAQEASS
ncbi:MAG: ArsA family ATPase [Candidatus Limnocylindria bacterium]